MAALYGHPVAIAVCLAGCARPVPVPEGAPTMKVPTGAWQRDWIQRHGGALERDVVVRYVQTPSVFGDVRTASERVDATSFADLSDDQLAGLARQNGFAGVATIDGATVTWHHEISFQPADGADIGRIEPAGDGQMLEHALDDSYVERWSSLGGGDGPFFAARAVRDGRVDQLLAVAGAHFVYARARATPLPAGGSISELIARDRPEREQLIGYLDCEISYGSVAGWQIERSTLPWRRGQRLALADRIAVDGTPRAEAGETWSEPVNTLFSPPL